MSFQDHDLDIEPAKPARVDSIWTWFSSWYKIVFELGSPHDTNACFWCEMAQNHEENDIRRRNSSSSIVPDRSSSASLWLIIKHSSLSDNLIWNSCAAFRSLLIVILPGLHPPSIPHRAANTILISSSGSTTRSSPFIRAVNSSRDTHCEPSASIASSIEGLRSASPCMLSNCMSFFVCWALWKPKAYMAARSSCLSIVPPPSVSNSSKTLLICSSSCADSVIWCCRLRSAWRIGFLSGWVSKYCDICRAKRVQ